MSKSPPKSRPFDRDLAVVIGINQYQEFPELKTARSDAERLAGILEKNYDYEVKRFLDEQATFANIQNHLKTELATKIESCKSKYQKVRLLFYFAGHGTPPGNDGEGGSLVPQDATRKTDKWLTMNELKKLLTDLNCDHLLIILDCCYAGSLSMTRKFEVIQDEEISRERYDNYLKFRAGQVIASTAHDETAMDAYAFTDKRGIGKNSHHSPFAELLFQALAPEDEAFTQAGTIGVADYNQDGITTATDLSVYLSDNLGKLTNNQQVSRTWCLPSLDKGEFFFQTGEFDPDKLPGAVILNQENNPYRGLKSFEEAHSRFFFGRDRAIENLEQHLNSTDRSLTVVLGISGSGKSSLVKAGLIPKLREHPTQWRILEPMRPGATPFAALARAVLPLILKSRHLDLEPLKQLDELLRSERKQSPDDKELKDLFAKWRRTAPEDKLFLIIKHFERFKKLCGADLALQQSLEDLRQLGSEHSKLVLDNYDELKKYLDPIKLDSFYHNCQNKIQEWSQSKIWQQDGKQLCELIDKNCPKNQKILLVIDQFEELIAQCKQEERQEFLNTLQTALAACPQQLRLVLTLRDDFKHDFENSAQLQKYWQEACFPVAQMGRDELRETIEQPAAAQVLIFEDRADRQGKSLVDRLLDDIGDTIGALPLLSFFLSELYEKYVTKARTDRTLRWEDYDELENVTKALTRKATEEYERLKYDSIDRDGKVIEVEVDSLETQARQTMLRWVILRMVNLNSGEITKRPVLLETELKYADTETDKNRSARCQLVIERFRAARLLVIGTNLEGKKYVEPAHDVLIREWDKIKTWLSETQQQVNQTQKQPTFDINLQRRLTPAATEWDSIKNQDKAQPKGGLDRVAPIFERLDRKLLRIENKFNFILNKIPAQFARLLPRSQNQQERFLWNADPYLDVLDRELKSDDNWLNQVEAEFVDQSVLQKRRNISWRWRGAILFVLVLILLTMWALWNQGLSKINEAKTLRESAEINLQKNQSLDGKNDGVNAGNILKEPLVQLLLLIEKLLPFQTDLQEQVRGTLLRAVYTVRELDRLPENPENQGKGTVRTSFSPDGNLLASAGENCKEPIRVWDLQGQTLSKSKPIELKFKDKPDKSDNFYNSPTCEQVKIARFSPNSQQLAAAGANGTVGVWDVRREDKELTNLKILNPKRGEFNPKQGEVKSISFSPDGKLLATTGANGTVVVWDVRREEHVPIPVSNLCSKYKTIWSLAFSPDGTKLAVTGDKGAISLWDREGNKWTKNKNTKFPDPKCNDKNENDVTSVNFSTQGQKLATAGSDGHVHVWDFQGKEQGKGIQTNQIKIWDVSFSPDGKKLATAGEDGTVRLWDWQGNELENEVEKLEGHQGPVRSVSFSPDGQILASAGDDGTVRLWKLWGNESESKKFANPSESNKVAAPMDDKKPCTVMVKSQQNDEACGEENGTVTWQKPQNQPEPMQSSHVGNVTSLAFSHDGNQLASGGKDKTIRLWDKDGKQNNLLPTYAIVNSLAYSADSKFLASAGKDGTVQLWNLQDLNNGKPFAAWKAYRGSVKTVIFSPDSQVLITAGEDGTTGMCKLWPIESFDRLMKQADDNVNGNPEQNSRPLCDGIKTSQLPAQPLVPIPKSPDRPAAVTPIDPKAAKEISELKGHQGSVRSVAFSPNGQTLATTGEDGTIRLWNAQGQQISQFQGNQTAIRSINFSPDGQKLVSDADGKIRLWDLQGKLLKEFVGSQKLIRSVKFNPNNGQQLASTGDDGTIHLWDLQGQSLAKWQADPKRVWDLAFSPDGQQMASAEASTSVSLWNLKGQLMKKFTGHIYPVLSVAFSPDSKQLVSGCNGGMIRSWSLPDYQMTNMFQVDRAELNSVAYSPDSKLIVSGDNQGNIKMWKSNTQQQSPVWTAHQNSIVRKVAFSPKGKIFATAADDGIVKLWQLE